MTTSKTPAFMPLGQGEVVDTQKKHRIWNSWWIWNSWLMSHLVMRRILILASLLLEAATSQGQMPYAPGDLLSSPVPKRVKKFAPTLWLRVYH